MVGVRLVLFRPENPSQKGPCAEGVKPLPGNLGHGEPLRALRGEVIEVLLVFGRGRDEHLLAVLNVFEIGGGDHNALEIQLVVLNANRKQVCGIADPQSGAGIAR